MEETMKYIDRNADRFVEDLRRLCRKPSISSQNKGVEDCAELVRQMMEEVGVKATLFPVKDGNPVVFGELGIGDDKTTLGFYNHYDVQPPEPLELWETPPFSARIRSGKIYARGVSDNKGDLVARLKAVEAISETLGRVPVSLKFFIEGEEEIGSPHLPSFVKCNMERLRADGYLWEGGGVDEVDRPVITFGVKGIMYLELLARGANVDVHSSMAPLVSNPAWRLIWALSSMKGPDERITIDDWYEEVKSPTEREEKLLRTMPFEEEKVKERLGLKEFLQGSSGVEALEKLFFNPTCTVCGFDSGYKGPGSKTVLPSKAMAKVDFRLVGDQTPEKLFKKVKQHLGTHGFGDIEVKMLGGYEPSKTPIDSSFAQRVIETARKVYRKEPVIWPTVAGTSPQYLIKNWMNIPVASGGGVGYFESKAHAPDENVRIKDFIRSIKYIVALIRSYD